MADGSDAKSELPLILFTTCTPAAVGVTAVGLVAGASALLACVAFVLTAVGMVASVAHLARPLRAPRSLRHLGSSWLSREIVVVSLFACALVLWGAASFFANHFLVLRYILNALALLVGCGLVIAIAKAYTLRGQPAWNGPDTFMEIIAIACMLGGSVSLVALIAIIPLSPIPTPSVGGDTPLIGMPFEILSFEGAFPDSLLDSSPLLPCACLTAAAMIFIGMLCCHIAWQMRVRRVAALATDDPRPRAIAAFQNIKHTHARLRRVLTPLFIIGALLAMISVALAFFAWMASPEYALIPNMQTEASDAALAAEDVFTASITSLATLAALVAAILCLILCVVASFRLRNSFYHLADTGRYAMRLHAW